MIKGWFFRIISDNAVARERRAALEKSLEHACRRDNRPINFCEVNGEVLPYDLMSTDADYAKVKTFEQAWAANIKWAGGEENLEYIGYGTFHHQEAMPDLEKMYRSS